MGAVVRRKPADPASPRHGADHLFTAREKERAGSIAEAMSLYEAAITEAEQHPEPTVLAEALRRLAVLRHHRDDRVRARELVRRSCEIAEQIGNDLLCAEALNTMGGLDLTSGRLPEAKANFLRALEIGGLSRELRARVEQNLGILANIQGELYEALTRYERSLAAYRAAGDEHGCALAYHNLGMVSADRGQFDAAESYYRESRAIAERTGDLFLQGLCLASQAESDVARQRFENARQNAENALSIFDQLGARGAKANSYRVIGMVYRETGRLALAESRLQASIDLAIEAGSVLNEAEASRELALLYQAMGRNQEALRQLNTAHRLFRRLDARVEMVHVGGKLGELENTFLAVVRNWARSVESRDNYTFGHCERVAQGAVALARLLCLDPQEQTTILFGSYLHDLGMVRVPHETLKRPGPLSQAELEIMRMHPLWGIELLGNVDIPWDVKPIVRWHHEHYDGTGYPDRLQGDEIPIAAQVVGIWDVYDAMRTARAHQPALSAREALERIAARRSWWSVQVFEGFLRVLAEQSDQPRSP